MTYRTSQDFDTLASCYDAVVAERNKLRDLLAKREDSLGRAFVAMHKAFMAMCAHRDSPDLEVFQDAIDELGMSSHHSKDGK